jgi:hypothetical protein
LAEGAWLDATAEETLRNPMHCYGYTKGSDTSGPAEMEEVTICAGPETLRRLAEFLAHTAKLIESHGVAFGHEHFEDFLGVQKPTCRLIVASPRPVEPPQT